MSENQDQLKSDDNLKFMKIAHDKHATVIHMFKTRFQFWREEFQPVEEIIAFYSALRDQLKAKIEEIEPPKPEEPKKPQVIDIPQGQVTQ